MRSMHSIHSYSAFEPDGRAPQNVLIEAPLHADCIE